MSEEHTESESSGQAELGLLSRAAGDAGIHPGDIIAALASLLWLALVGSFFLFSDTATGEGGALGSVMVLVAIFAPLALIWIAAITLRMSREMKAETRRLQASIDAMRQAYLNSAQSGSSRSTMERRLDEIAAAAKQAEKAITSFTARRDAVIMAPAAADKAALVAPRTPEPANEQPGLALGTPPDAAVEPISVSDFIKAMNFPDNQNDKDGFRALRRALEDRSTSKLVRAAQDALTLLSQDGIYMDDLRPDRARPEIWRRFAQGERGRQISALGGVRDRSSLALTSGRMRQDTIFRDTAHHFLRQFDKALQEFERNASDQEIAALAETRTARAFMLLGRVTGIFN